MKEGEPEGPVHQEGRVFFQRYGRNLLYFMSSKQGSNILIIKSRKHIYCQKRGGSQEHLQGAAPFDFYGVVLSNAENSNFMGELNKTINDGGITVDFSIIKVHTSN